ncbi:MAG: hypothetical protein IJY11_00800 [Clostridia bacterium]|nr:hypothetical protein [Clostridia bacterium]
MRKKKLLALVAACLSLCAVGFTACEDQPSAPKTTYYGTNVQYYVTPVKGESNPGDSEYETYGNYEIAQMQAMINLLEGESFTGMLLDGILAADQTYVQAEKGTAGYTAWMNVLSNSLTFTYEKTNGLAENFITVSLLVEDVDDLQNEKEIAELILAQVLDKVEGYVEENMETPTGYTATRCNRTTINTEIQTVKR